MNYQVIYDIADAPELTWLGVFPLALYLLALVVVLVGLRKLQGIERFAERIVFVMSLAFAALFTLFFGMTMQSGFSSAEHDRQEKARALRSGAHQTAEGPASFDVRDGRLVRGKPAHYRVTATVAGVQFYHTDKVEPGAPRFYGVPAEGNPRLRIAYLKDPHHPRVLRVEMAY